MGNEAYYRGAGVFVLSGSPSFLNNTIAINHTTSSSTTAQGGGIYCYSTSSAGGRNNILHSNTASASYPNFYGNVSFTYSCVGQTMTGVGNINTNPIFINTPLSTYCMLSQTASGQSQNSPCVDAGMPGTTMITGSTRTDMVQDEGTIDMGYHWTASISNWFDLGDILDIEDMPTLEDNVPVSCEMAISNYPNPFNPETTISLLLRKAGEVELTVTDITGRVVETPFAGYLQSGVHEFKFSGSNLSTGVYFYTAKSGNELVSGKALLVK